MFKKTFIVAELSANHLQNLDIALKTIDAIKQSGADAVKLQSYTPDSITIDVKSDLFKISEGTIWDGEYLYDLYKRAYTPPEWHEKLFEHAKNLGLECFSTPFDEKAVEMLESLDVKLYKIASFEITDIPLIELIASKQKPILISTGIATLSDIEAALNACYKVGNKNITLLKCVSEYPTPFEHVNLLTIKNMAETFKTQVGISDHTVGISVPIAAVALGAKVVEKHFILDRSLGGPDAAFSLEPAEFSQMVKGIREVELALGEVTYELTKEQQRMRKFSRSLFAVKDIKSGEEITKENVRSIRPSFGLHPKHLGEILGKKAKIDIKAGTPISWELIE
ncbi:MAG: pseudaminic acid synthase [Aquificaceae bacterium]|nr:pseudaminic acid synthase [Aquificaceae bacterium]MDW8237197.1 pseudaminic acid synthase [Aquificaceae bacterium]